MFLGNHPGPWQYYVNRPDNKSLPIMEVRDKYLREQYLFESQYNTFIQQMQSNAASGGSFPEPTPTVESGYVVNGYVGSGYF